MRRPFAALVIDTFLSSMKGQFGHPARARTYGSGLGGGRPAGPTSRRMYSHQSGFLCERAGHSLWVAYEVTNVVERSLLRVSLQSSSHKGAQPRRRRPMLGAPLA